MKTGGASCVEYLGGGISLDIVGYGHCGAADYGENYRNGEGFESTKYIGGFGHGRFNNSYLESIHIHKRLAVTELTDP